MHDLLKAELRQRFPALPEIGFEHGNGWYRIVGGAFAMMDQVRRRTGQRVKIQQIKEKFGCLRIYHGTPMTSLERDVFELLTGRLSSQTCEACGLPGKPNRGGWVVTQCDFHRELREHDGLRPGLYRKTLKELIAHFDDGTQPERTYDTALAAAEGLIIKRLLAEPEPQGLLMPEGKTDFVHADSVGGHDSGWYRIRRFRVETPELPDVSGQPLDDILAPVVDKRVTSDEGKVILKAWSDEGVLSGAMPMGLAWWFGEEDDS